MAKSIAALGACLLLTLGACTTPTGTEEIHLYYADAIVGGKRFQECVPPDPESGINHSRRRKHKDRFRYPDNPAYVLPTSLQTWAISRGGSNSTPIVVTSRPGPKMHVWVSIEFHLNSYCGPENNSGDSPVVQFWETVGSRYKVSDRDGFNQEAWAKMLQENLTPVLDGVVRKAASIYASDELDSNTNGTWRNVERRMHSGSNDFNLLLERQMGGRYFCGVNFDRTKPECPPVKVTITGIDYVDRKLQQARIAVRMDAEAAREHVARVRQELSAARLRAQAGNPDHALLMSLEHKLEDAQLREQKAQRCLADPNCTDVTSPGTVKLDR